MIDIEKLNSIRGKKGYLCDMDGVLYHGNSLLPGVKDFFDWLNKENKEYLFFTNSNSYIPAELQAKLGRMGLDVGVEHFYTSAQATAKFLAKQIPGGTAYVIGEHGLYNALYDVGISIDDINPDFVVVGECKEFNYNHICKASDLVSAGARLIATNPDILDPVENGFIPTTGSLVLPIEAVTGKKAYYIGKPNALMTRTGLKILDIHSSEGAIIGDRMDTDIVAGLETGLDTVLVLSGVSTLKTVEQFAYRPTVILNGVGDIANA